MRLAAARAESRIAGFSQERVREATGLSEEGSEMEAWERVQCATGASVGARGGGTLGGWCPLSVGI